MAEGGYKGSDTPLSHAQILLNLAGVGPTGAPAFLVLPQAPTGAVSLLSYITALSSLWCYFKSQTPHDAGQLQTAVFQYFSSGVIPLIIKQNSCFIPCVRLTCLLLSSYVFISSYSSNIVWHIPLKTITLQWENGCFTYRGYLMAKGRCRVHGWETGFTAVHRKEMLSISAK